MSQVVKPSVTMVSAPYIADLEAYLISIGDPDWHVDSEVSDAENLVEAGGRMCYRSWQPYDKEKPDASNANVHRVRKGNAAYIENILKSGHGSVLEHASIGFIFKDVSRVFTHEIVRHRVGTAFSQESLRYVRLADGIKYPLPSVIANHEGARLLFERAMSTMEGWQRELEDMFQAELDPASTFHAKKELTSAFRRIAPDGLATSIMITANIRTWRHIIQMRTSPGAEEEARIAIGMVAEILKKNFPSFFQDMDPVYHPGNPIPEWTFKYRNV